MKRAEIIDGRIVNIIEVDPDNVPDWCAGWIDPGDAGIGWLHLPDDTFAPEVPFVTLTVEEAINQIVKMIDVAAVVITGEVPEVEKLSWTAKEQAARASLSGGITIEQLALLSIEANTRGETIEELATKVVLNADLYRAAVAAMTGTRRRALALLDAGDDPATVVAYVRDTLATITNKG